MKRPKKSRKGKPWAPRRIPVESREELVQSLAKVGKRLLTAHEGLRDAVAAIDAQTVSQSWTWADVERLDLLRALARGEANR